MFFVKHKELTTKESIPAAAGMNLRPKINYLALAVGAAASVLLAGTSLAQTRENAQSYPSRPIRIIVPNTAGSAQDIAARLVAQRLADTMGQQTVVDNRAGATGVIGMDITAKAASDGYTLVVATSAGLVTNPLLSKVP